MHHLTSNIRVAMGLEGDLSDFGLVDIIQLIDLGKKTGVVELQGERGRETLQGTLFFCEGKIWTAQAGALTGDEAAFTLFTCMSGPFRFSENVPLPTQNVQVSNEIVIMEGIGRQDAWMTIAELVPSGDLILRLTPNPRSSGREINLEADTWRVLTLINGRSSVDQIVEKAGLSQFRTFQIAAELIQSGLVEGRMPASSPVPYPELERIAIAGAGSSARVLLADAYRRVGLRPGDSQILPSQAAKAITLFEQATTSLLGTGRARTLADQLRARVA